MVYEARSTFKFFNEPLKCVLGGRCKFTLANGTECEALVSGIGCKKSAERVRECVESFCPTDVVLCGFGGACGEDMEIGEFVFQSGSAEISKFLSRNGMREGKIAYSEGVADENAKRKFASEGYDIVEMVSDIFSAALVDDYDFKTVLTHIWCVRDTLKK